MVLDDFIHHVLRNYKEGMIRNPNAEYLFNHPEFRYSLPKNYSLFSDVKIEEEIRIKPLKIDLLIIDSDVHVYKIRYFQSLNNLRTENEFKLKRLRDSILLQYDFEPRLYKANILGNEKFLEVIRYESDKNSICELINPEVLIDTTPKDRDVFRELFEFGQNS